MVTECAYLKSKVKLGNRIRFDKTKAEPKKENIVVSDVPELMLVPEGFNNLNLCATSSSSMCTRVYSWQITTGTYAARQLFEVEWGIFMAMSLWKTKLSSLTWNKLTFVKRVQFLDVLEGVDDTQANRSMKGWSAIWRTEVEMHFKTQDLIDGCS